MIALEVESKSNTREVPLSSPPAKLKITQVFEPTDGSEIFATTGDWDSHMMRNLSISVLCLWNDDLRSTTFIPRTPQ